MIHNDGVRKRKRKGESKLVTSGIVRHLHCISLIISGAGAAPLHRQYRGIGPRFLVKVSQLIIPCPPLHRYGISLEDSPATWSLQDFTNAIGDRHVTPW